MSYRPWWRVVYCRRCKCLQKFIKSGGHTFCAICGGIDYVLHVDSATATRRKARRSNGGVEGGSTH